MFTMDEYQKQARGTASYQEGIHRFSEQELRRLTAISYCLHGLCGEAGESADKFKKYLRSTEVDWPTLRSQLVKELGDCLWYVSSAAHELGISLDDLARENLEKLADRRSRGVIHGSGDQR